MSSKLIFRQEHETYEGLIKTYEMSTEEVCLHEVLDDFADFLRGCGYQVKGNLEIVDE